jgi:electron-transferring-flavoprotein dehydrogenase
LEREAREFDVVIVGTGASRLAAASRLSQPCAERDRDLSCCVVENGSEAGAHMFSGAVLKTRALDELVPDWTQKGRPSI